MAGVEGAVSGAEGAIGNSTAETDGTYELDGDNDGVGEAVEGAEGAIANSIDTTDGKYILGVNIDGVVSGLAAASQKIKEWQEAYNQLHEGRPEGAFPSGN